MRKIFVVAALLIAGVVGAGTIKSWASGETLTATDLNNNFSHIHTLMVGGHGARLVNADVNANAAIATSKLASYRYIPRAWVTVLPANAGCGLAATACTETSGSGATTVVGSAVGSYTVTLGYTATDATYAVNVSPNTTSGFLPDAGVRMGPCFTANLSTTTFNVTCREGSAGTNTDMGFTAVVFDDN